LEDGVGGGEAATNPILIKNPWMPCHFDRREKSRKFYQTTMINNPKYKTQEKQNNQHIYRFRFVIFP
jgi:hypothetical protein